VLIGTPHIPIPKHPRIHHLGFLEDQDKYDAMAAAELLIMPSYLESLSMVALEAWAMGKPVLANAKCDVLQGQCLRSNAGLFYANFAEFAETMRAIDTTPSLQAALGRNGRAFFERHYAWPVIEKKYVDMLQQLSRDKSTRTMEPPLGWFARRRRSQRPADEVVKGLPAGPYRESKRPSAIGSQPSAETRRPAQPPQQQQQPRKDWRSDRPDQRPPRPDHRGPKPDLRGPRADQRAQADSRQPKAESQPRADSRQPKADRGDDQRRRHHRRGRRPQGRGNR